MNEQARDAFVRALREDGDVGVRRVAADALRALADPATVPALIDALRDDVAEIRQAAIAGLIDIGEASIPHLHEAMRSPVTAVRIGAATVLGGLSAQAPEATDATLTEALGDDEPEVRKLAAYALGEKGQVAEAAYRALIDRLGDKQPAVRRTVAEALGKLVPHGEGAVGPLAVAMRDPEAEVRRAAAEAVKQIMVG